MSDIEIEKFLLYLNGVTVKELNFKNKSRNADGQVNLLRYLFHDMPFAVLCSADKRILHLKVTNRKKYELKAKFGNLIKDSGIYDSLSFVAFNYSLLPEPDLKDALLSAYANLFNRLSKLASSVYVEPSVKYDKDYEKAIMHTSDQISKIDYSFRLKNI